MIPDPMSLRDAIEWLEKHPRSTITFARTMEPVPGTKIIEVRVPVRAGCVSAVGKTIEDAVTEVMPKVEESVLAEEAWKLFDAWRSRHMKDVTRERTIGIYATVRCWQDFSGVGEKLDWIEVAKAARIIYAKQAT